MTRPATRRARLLTGASIGLFALVLDATAVPVALPSARLELGASTTGLQWVQNAYLLTLAALVLLLVLGRLGDALGRGPVFGFGVLAFGAGSAFSATADSVAELIGGRAVQGAGAGALLAISLGTARLASAREDRRRAAGGRAAAAALALGPLVGGVAAQVVGWRLVFWLGAAVAALGFAVAALGSPDRHETIAGAARARATAGALAATFALAGAYCVLIYYLPQYTELVLGHSALASGVLALPVTAPIVAAAPFGRAFAARVGTRALMTAGVACAALGMLVLTRLDGAAGYAQILPALLPVGVGLGLVLAALPAAAALSGALGGALLLAACGAVFRDTELESRLEGASFDGAFADAFAAAAWPLAAVLAVAALLAWLLGDSRLEHAELGR